MESQIIKRSPSNIAIVKYWGKHGNQLPNNPSISFTLTNCFTETKITYDDSETQRLRDSETQFSFDFYFEGKESKAFKDKIEKFILKNEQYFTFLKGLHFKIESYNSFPHSSGIASSASSMSALVMCLLGIKYKDSEIDMQEASFLSRLASGSASRSVYPTMTLWGKTPALSNSSDEYAVPIGDMINPIFKSYHDTILIVSSKEKSVSSRAGHSLMNNHPMAESRYATARKNTEDLLTILKQGDLEGFIKIAEAEANQLHDLMATSTPAYTLKEPNTVNIINKILEFREDTSLPICYTLDAGPNVHLLYPDFCKDKVHVFIEDVLKDYCHNNKYINDRVSADS
ncbi:MAG: hypothetical protein IJE76_02575 [Bacteroidales bacterium]|nr:hypothetical protein [Bacteroidales bacterium]